MIVRVCLGGVLTLIFDMLLLFLLLLRFCLYLRPCSNPCLNLFLDFFEVVGVFEN